MSSTHPTFAIRPVRPEEHAALGELTIRAYHSLEGYADPDPYDARLRDVAGRAAVSCVAVAVDPDGTLLGGVTYVSGPEDPYSEDLREGEAGIRMLAVDPAHQGRGVGRALTEWCLERARSSSRSRMVLHTSFLMPGAIHLYERIGFVRNPDLDFSPVAGVHLIAYAYDLTSS